MKEIRSNATLHNTRTSSPISLSPLTNRISDPARTLLVVDDDPLIRGLEVHVLRLHGFNVLEAQGASEAMQLARKAVAIDLLITDFSMPEVDGMELSRQFRTVHPRTPVLMVSGSLPLIKNQVEEKDRLDFLNKPFQFDELLNKVNNLLEASAPRPIRNHCA